MPIRSNSLALAHGTKNPDGNNLNNPVRHTYQINENAPTNWYVSGRQYSLSLRMKLLRQQQSAIRSGQAAPLVGVMRGEWPAPLPKELRYCNPDCENRKY
jgi:hypothetical protein